MFLFVHPFDPTASNNNCSSSLPRIRWSGKVVSCPVFVEQTETESHWFIMLSPVVGSQQWDWCLLLFQKWLFCCDFHYLSFMLRRRWWEKAFSPPPMPLSLFNVCKHSRPHPSTFQICGRRAVQSCRPSSLKWPPMANRGREAEEAEKEEKSACHSFLKISILLHIKMPDERWVDTSCWVALEEG